MAVGTAGPISAALATRRGIAALIALAMAVAVGIGIFYRGAYPFANVGSPAEQGLSDQLRQGVNGMKTVADMLLGRSPGERASGALANLKHKRLALAHERALPKLRGPAPLTSLAAIAGPPGAPLVPIAAASPPAMLESLIGPAPTIAEAPPILFPAMSPVPGGGFVIPPVITQVSPPTTPSPVTLAVPEPASWAMMLIGFAFIGSILRRNSSAAPAFL